jgi:Mycothiol maleylpyruvate isomerase N-terminal domain
VPHDGVLPAEPNEAGEVVVSEISDRYRRVAGQFTQRVEAVPDGAWDNPAPCEGWVARDVVGHLVEWMKAAGPGTAFEAGLYELLATTVPDGVLTRSPRIRRVAGWCCPTVARPSASA